MRKILFLLMFFFACASAETIRVASWNVRCIQKSDSLQGDAWSKRVPEIANVVKFRQFDVLGLQEVDTVQYLMLAPLLQEYRWLQDEFSEGNPILFLKDRFDLVNRGIFWYSSTGIPREKGWDAKNARYCFWVRLQDKNTKKDFFVFNTHWDHKGEIARVESARMTTEQVPFIAGKTATIFMGDLNIKPNRKASNRLKKNGVFREALLTAPVLSIPEGSFTKFRTDRHSEETLDHMFYRGNIEILRYGILRETYFDGETYRFPSDHHPVMGEFEIK